MADGASVVVVTYNAAGYVEQCLESLGGHETVVVDNGSTDGTVELVRARFPGVTGGGQENRGMGAGNNAGRRVAGGPFWPLPNSGAWVIGAPMAAPAPFADEPPRPGGVGPRLQN